MGLTEKGVAKAGRGALDWQLDRRRREGEDRVERRKERAERGREERGKGGERERGEGGESI